MDYIDKLRHLRVINYFNLNGPYTNDESKNTDMTIVKSIHTFLQIFDSEIKQNYTFIIKYDNDIFSLLAYKIIKNASIILGKDLDIRYYCENLTPEEKEYFKGIKPIGLRKAKKLKKAVLITGFNPICNVDADGTFSKIFIDIYRPLEHFTPKNLRILQNFYFDKEKDKKIFVKNLGLRNENEQNWESYFSYPITNMKNNNTENFETETFLRKHLETLKNNVPVVIFTLSGTERDFPLYDFILKSSKEGNIHIYYVDGDIDFVKTNLSPYLDFRNQLNEINLISYEEFKELTKIIKEDYFYYYNTFKGGEETNNE